MAAAAAALAAAQPAQGLTYEGASAPFILSIFPPRRGRWLKRGLLACRGYIHTDSQTGGDSKKKRVVRRGREQKAATGFKKRDHQGRHEEANKNFAAAPRKKREREREE